MSCTSHTPRSSRMDVAQLANYGRTEELAAALARGEDPDDDGDFMDGKSPLILAVCSAHSYDDQCVELLLAHGADVTPADCNGRTALHHAAVFGNVALAKAFLERGAEVDAEDVEGNTPLLFAVPRRSREMVQLLLEHGARVDAVDHDGRTALHVAVERGIVAVRPLLEHGVDPFKRDKSGVTPFGLTKSEKVRALMSEHAASTYVALLLVGMRVGGPDGEDNSLRRMSRSSMCEVQVLREVLACLRGD